MADQVFTSGQILTAAQMTALQANSGLVYIKTQTIGSAVSTVNVTSAFSATYDAYKIVVTGGTPSANSNMRLVFGASVTGYYASRNGVTWSTGLRSDGVDNNAAIWAAVGTSLTNGLSAEITCVNPGLAKYTTIAGFYSSTDGSVNYSGIHQVATAYTDFTISPSSGTWTGGTVIVYGYRLS
jgi:hypothetical protein